MHSAISLKPTPSRVFKKCRHGKKKAKRARQDSGSESVSETEEVVMTTARTPGVIEKLGLTFENRPAGLVSFQLKNGKKHLGVFREDRSVANGYRLETMRAFANDQSVTLPFRVGMSVGVFNSTRLPVKRNNASHRVQVEVTSELEDTDERAEVDNLDGLEVTGIVTAFEDSTGVASFLSSCGRSVLAHLTILDVIFGGVSLPVASYPHAIHPGMTVSLKITGSASRAIQGVNYTADAVARILTTPLSTPLTPLTPTNYRGVILKLSNNLPTLFACFLTENTPFFVACTSPTSNGQPLSESDLNFGEGTRVLCSVTLNSASEPTKGHLYEASVDLPTVRAKILKLTTVNACNYPSTLSAEIEGEERRLVIAKRDLRVNGKKPGVTFPRNFFKVDMEVDLNDVWKINALETRATLDVSTNILVGKSAEGLVAAGGMKRPPPVDGVVSAVRENDRGLVLPSRANARVGGVIVPVDISPSQVTINTKTGGYLPPSLVNMGDPVKLYNLRLSKETDAHTAVVQYFFPKDELKRAFEEHRQNMSM